ncbi:adenylate/guanylate cyclase domain-containing protein [Sneathiella chinensis]|uniref:Adenylate cyclase n=1 Tax=Sneathiella chinensis TaxID=349750 RepID=A0ABQ5U695_9PROT|nr:adenylate/guanylate cyclase domain-containing protein [Sneathiella chinensis]GLQ07682.1 adenylate cyclase [Sneathiella chinensis]
MGSQTIKTEQECKHLPAQTPEEEFFDWLMEAGLSGLPLADLLAQFCERLEALDVRIQRANIALSAIHPQVSAFMYTWRKSEGTVLSTNILHSDEPGEGWFASPFFYMLSNNTYFLHRPLQKDSDLDFPVLVEFRDEGLTDWFARIFDFGWSHENLLPENATGLITSWATCKPGGFTERDFALLGKAVPLLGLAIKGIASFDMAETVLQTYVGRGTSRKVLSGNIQRGAADSIDAVLVFADLRGFTVLSDRINQSDIMFTLDEYLERMADPIERAGGEILKFMGDGMLATFPMRPDEEEDICRTALLSAIEMLSRIKELNLERQAKGLLSMELDVALHVGEVMYGNVGSQTRLDFTVVGSAVNEVSRMESLCDALGRDFVISGEFARRARTCTEILQPLGHHVLRGVEKPKELFGLSPQAALLIEAHTCL